MLVLCSAVLPWSEMVNDSRVNIAAYALQLQWRAHIVTLVFTAL